MAIGTADKSFVRLKTG